jgi:hypothetical protein
LGSRPALFGLAMLGHRVVPLTLALRPAPPMFAEQVRRGRAMIRGECTRCGGPWEACATRCVKWPPRPEPTSDADRRARRALLAVSWLARVSSAIAMGA